MALFVSVGITAHNEEANIGRLLANLLEQKLDQVVLDEILVVASGCTDRTEAIAAEWAIRDGRIRLLVQPTREGKASAINWFMQEARHDLLVVCSADLLPAPETLERLVRPLADPETGMTGAHPVPVNDPGTMMGYIVHLLWRLHHEINLAGQFKAGEMIAFRRIFERIPNHTAVDEASVEPIIRGQGFRVRYVPEAVVYNKGPETVADFLKQRRRIHAGHLQLRRDLGYAVSTMSGKTILPLFLRGLEWGPRRLAWGLAAALLEVYGRWLGSRDFKRQRSHTVWDIAASTKQLEQTPHGN